MSEQTDPRMRAGTTPEDDERWSGGDEDLPTEDLDPELVDDDYDDVWPEPKESARAERRRRSDAEPDDDLDAEWKLGRRGRKPRRDHRGRRMKSGSDW